MSLSTMPRVPYVTQDELDADYRDLIVSSLQPDKTVNLYRALGQNQEVLRGLREFLGVLWNHSGLTDRQRELVILTVASEVGSEYEWHQHVNIARDNLELDEIAAIALDEHTPFSEEERALVAYTRAVADSRVTDVLHEVVSEYFDENTVVGVASIAAFYVAIGRTIDALGVDIETSDEFIGWEPK